MKKYIPNTGDLVEVECPFYKTTAIGIITNITISKLTRKFIKDDIKEVIKSLGCENDDFRLVQKIN